MIHTSLQMRYGMSAAEGGFQREVQALYSDHRAWLQGWLQRRLRCSDDAADLVHDTFIRVLRHRARIDELREPRAYLTTIARNLLFNHYQRQSLEQTYREVLAQLPEAQAPSSEQSLLLLEALHEVDAVLSGLPRVTRAAFLLAQIEGLSYDVIAQRLNISVRTVQRHIVRAFQHCILVAA